MLYKVDDITSYSAPPSEIKNVLIPTPKALKIKTST